MENNVKFDIKTLESNMLQQSLKLEGKLALDALNNISSAFTEDVMIVDGVRFNRIMRSKEVTIGRVTVSWERPIYEGSKNGKTVYCYPADDCLKLPKKTKQSYWNLSIVALLGAFIPYKLVAYIMKVLCGTRMSESSVQRYTETVGQFAKENMPDILENRTHLSDLKKDEILIASIDGSSSMINGNNQNPASRKSKKKKKKKVQEEKVRTKIKQKKMDS